MSKFYGSVVGNRGVATRCGTINSGFRSSCQSYDGSIICDMRYNEEGQLIVNVGTNDRSSCYSDMSSYDFNGTFEEFKELLKIHHLLKNKKASITHHRQKTNK